MKTTFMPGKKERKKKREYSSEFFTRVLCVTLADGESVLLVARSEFGSEEKGETPKLGELGRDSKEGILKRSLKAPRIGLNDLLKR